MYIQKFRIATLQCQCYIKTCFTSKLEWLISIIKTLVKSLQTCQRIAGDIEIIARARQQRSIETDSHFVSCIWRSFKKRGCLRHSAVEGFGLIYQTCCTFRNNVIDNLVIFLQTFSLGTLFISLTAYAISLVEGGWRDFRDDDDDDDCD